MFGKTELEIVKRLDERTFAYFNEEATRRRKSVGVTYALWFFFGWAGVHKLYLQKYFSGIVYLLSSITIWFAIIRVGAANYDQSNGFVLFLLALVAVLVVGIGWLLDLFTIPGQVEDANRFIKLELLRQLDSLNPAAEEDENAE